MREIIDSMCGTFNICNPNEFHLWIPAGIQSIIEKYGGRPVSLLLFIAVLSVVVLFIVLLIIVFVIFSAGLHKLTNIVFVIIAETSCWSVQKTIILFHWRLWYVRLEENRGAI